MSVDDREDTGTMMPRLALMTASEDHDPYGSYTQVRRLPNTLTPLARSLSESRSTICWVPSVELSSYDLISTMSKLPPRRL